MEQMETAQRLLGCSFGVSGVKPGRRRKSDPAPVKARDPKASVAELVDARDSHSLGMLQQ